MQPYSPNGAFTAADFLPTKPQMDYVQTWDTSVLEQRMRQLVTDAPYYRPEQPSLQVVKVHGRSQLTVDGARELDLQSVPAARSWSNNRLAYTHGLGLIRFSGTDVERTRGPRLLNAGLGTTAPRIYFGNFPRSSGTSRWVVADTRRPEVDIPAIQGSPATPYHYTGTGGIRLSSWPERALFALALRSKDLLLSNDITSHSRLLLHRDVHDRLRTLAPFVQWDSDAMPVAENGRLVFVVDGYTTSADYPYGLRITLGSTQVNYARASVVATVDAFSGRVELYLADNTDPIAQAWAAIFPTLLHPVTEMPSELRSQLRYPIDLFKAQATAYDRFHTTQPGLFVSNADAWSRPIGLSGPINLAGGATFGGSDSDDHRLKLKPQYSYAPPPGQRNPQLVLQTYYSPRHGQNLVASLSGWIDAQGRPRLTARVFPLRPVVLGPAQTSRLVFESPRVSKLLGLRNLETEDLSKSSLESVLLGQTHLLLLPSGVIQIQSLYEGSRGPGAARLLGVTAFVDGRAGLGPDVQSAVRQALNRPPRIRILGPQARVVVGKPAQLGFRVENAQREIVTITSASGAEHETLTTVSGRGTIEWLPRAAGDAQLLVTVLGLDGTRVSAVRELGVRSAPRPFVSFTDHGVRWSGNPSASPSACRRPSPSWLASRPGPASSSSAASWFTREPESSHGPRKKRARRSS